MGGDDLSLCGYIYSVYCSDVIRNTYLYISLLYLFIYILLINIYNSFYYISILCGSKYYVNIHILL